MPISLLHLILQMNLDSMMLTVYANKYISFDWTVYYNADSLFHLIVQMNLDSIMLSAYAKTFISFDWTVYYNVVSL